MCSETKAYLAFYLGLHLNLQQSEVIVALKNYILQFEVRQFVSSADFKNGTVIMWAV